MRLSNSGTGVLESGKLPAPIGTVYNATSLGFRGGSDSYAVAFERNRDGGLQLRLRLPV